MSDAKNSLTHGRRTAVGAVTGKDLRAAVGFDHGATAGNHARECISRGRINGYGAASERNRSSALDSEGLVEAVHVKLTAAVHCEERAVTVELVPGSEANDAPAVDSGRSCEGVDPRLVQDQHAAIDGGGSRVGVGGAAVESESACAPLDQRAVTGNHAREGRGGVGAQRQSAAIDDVNRARCATDRPDRVAGADSEGAGSTAESYGSRIGEICAGSGGEITAAERVAGGGLAAGNRKQTLVDGCRARVVAGSTQGQCARSGFDQGTCSRDFAAEGVAASVIVGHCGATKCHCSRTAEGQRLTVSIQVERTVVDDELVVELVGRIGAQSRTAAHIDASGDGCHIGGFVQNQGSGADRIRAGQGVGPTAAEGHGSRASLGEIAASGNHTTQVGAGIVASGSQGIGADRNITRATDRADRFAGSERDCGATGNSHCVGVVDSGSTGEIESSGRDGKGAGSRIRTRQGNRSSSGLRDVTGVEDVSGEGGRSARGSGHGDIAAEVDFIIEGRCAARAFRAEGARASAAGSSLSNVDRVAHGPAAVDIERHVVGRGLIAGIETEVERAGACASRGAVRSGSQSDRTPGNLHLGVSSSPVVRDDKRTAAVLEHLARGRRVGDTSG